MSGKNTALFGMYPTHGKVDAAVDALRAKGLLSSDISEPSARNIPDVPRNSWPDSGFLNSRRRGAGGRMRTAGILGRR
jgi:hypothetical protein